MNFGLKLGAVSALSLFTLLSTSHIAHAEDLELQDRIDELELQLLDLQEQNKYKNVSALSAIDFDFGGFFITEALHTDIEGGNSASGVPTATFLLNIKAKIGDKWHAKLSHGFGTFVTAPEVNLQGNPALANSGFARLRTQNIPVITTNANNQPVFSTIDNSAFDEFNAGDSTLAVEAYLRYEGNAQFNLTAGRYRTPIGIASRELSIINTNFPYYVKNGFSGTGQIYGVLLQGVSIDGGIHDPFSNRLGYSLFWGTTIGTQVSLLNPPETSEPQGGLRLSYNLADLGLEVGVAYMAGTRQDLVLPLPAPLLVGGVPQFDANMNVLVDPASLANTANYGGNDFDLLSVDLYYTKKFFTLKAEYFDSNEGAGRNHRRAHHVETRFSLTDRWELYLYQNETDVVNQTTDAQAIAQGLREVSNVYTNLGEVEEKAIGVNFRPLEKVWVGVGHKLREYPDQNDLEVKEYFLSFSGSF